MYFIIFLSSILTQLHYSFGGRGSRLIPPHQSPPPPLLFRLSEVSAS